jgi:rhodanese-related sulfurtransferase
MKKRLFVLTMAVLLSALVSVGAGAQPTAPADSGIRILSFSTDKDVYRSNEEMTIHLSVYSPEEMNNVLIKVSGVKSTKGIYHVAFSNETNFNAGENKLTLTKQLPSCFGCNRIQPGTHFITASITNGKEEVTATHSIAITTNQTIPVDIVVEEAKRMSESEELIILDVRTGEEYNAAHIDGALLIPISELSNRTEKLNKSRKIVVYDENVSNSTTACTILIEEGFERVYNVLGGINAWNESGYPLVATATPKLPGLEAVLALVAMLIVAYWLRRR